MTPADFLAAGYLDGAAGFPPRIFAPTASPGIAKLYNMGHSDGQMLRVRVWLLTAIYMGWRPAPDDR